MERKSCCSYGRSYASSPSCGLTTVKEETAATMTTPKKEEPVVKKEEGSQEGKTGFNPGNTATAAVLNSPKIEGSTVKKEEAAVKVQQVASGGCGSSGNCA